MHRYQKKNDVLFIICARKMDFKHLAYECTFWRERHIPLDIFNLVSQYLSPGVCYYCERFKGFSEVFCEHCVTSNLEELQKRCLFYSKLSEEKLSKEDYDALVWSFNYSYSQKLFHLKNETDRLLIAVEELNELVDRHQPIIRFVYNCDSKMCSENQNDYFAKIQHRKYFYLVGEKKKYEKIRREYDNLEYKLWHCSYEMYVNSSHHINDLRYEAKIKLDEYQKLIKPRAL